jgi:hypothetical protein
MDVSGTPYGTTIPALVSIQTHKVDMIEKSLRSKFFEGIHIRKGKKLNPNELLEIA